MKNIIIALLTCAVLALGGYTYHLQTNMPVQQPEVAPEPVLVKAAPEPEPAPVEITAPADEVEWTDPDSFTDTSKEAAAIDQLKKANNLIAALHEANQELEEETKPDVFKGIKQIMESPEIQGMMRQGMDRNMKRRNAALFRWLDLDEEQEKAVQELMIENGIQEMGRGIQWMAGNVDESNEQLKASKAAMHASLEELIGPEKLDVYKYFEDTKNERDSVSRFNRRLGENALDDAASDELVGMMYDTRANFPELDNLSQPENFNPREMTPEKREDVMGQVEELHGRYVQNAAPMLSEEQLQSYEQNLEQQRRQLNGFLQFSHGMINRREQAAQQPQE